jgi:hypothetical protein
LILTRDFSHNVIAVETIESFSACIARAFANGLNIHGILGRRYSADCLNPRTVSAQGQFQAFVSIAHLILACFESFAQIKDCIVNESLIDAEFGGGCVVLAARVRAFASRALESCVRSLCGTNFIGGGAETSGIRMSCPRASGATKSADANSKQQPDTISIRQESGYFIALALKDW